MTPDEAVLMDLLLERGYTREQAARALVALTLPEPTVAFLGMERNVEDRTPAGQQWMAAEIQAMAERRGYLPKVTP